MANRILVVDDEKNIRTMVTMILQGEDFAVDLADSVPAAEQLLSDFVPDAILLDVRLPQISGLEALKSWLTQYPTVPIVLMSGEASIAEALEGLKLGAFDFLEKPFRSEKLCATLRRAIRDANLRSKIAEQKPESIVGNSAALKEILAQISRIAPTQSRVLVLGESGTGKDLVARAIHDMSSRADKLVSQEASI